MSWWLDYIGGSDLPFWVGGAIFIVFSVVYSAYWRANIDKWNKNNSRYESWPETTGITIGFFLGMFSMIAMIILPVVLIILGLILLFLALYWPLVLLFRNIQIKVK